MLSPPADLVDDELTSVLADRWNVTASSATYRPVGWGSHHWEVVDAGGARWFATVDELVAERPFGRLRGALAAALALRDHGGSFVVAPVPTLDGEPLARFGGRFAVALYPFVDGQSFEWGEFSSPAHRRATLDLVVAVHAAPEPVRRLAMADDFSVPHRTELDAALAGAGRGDGPYGEAAARLVTEHAGPIAALLGRYDELVASVRARSPRAVLTHGEPHPGNTMRTADGWLLIDWDTALLAPPERDLWGFDPGDGSVLDAYAGATGVRPSAEVCELYRLRWTVADIAVDVGRFRRPHTGSPDDVKSWELLEAIVRGLTSTP